MFAHFEGELIRPSNVKKNESTAISKQKLKKAHNKGVRTDTKVNKMLIPSLPCLNNCIITFMFYSSYSIFTYRFYHHTLKGISSFLNSELFKHVQTADICLNTGTYVFHNKLSIVE